MASVRQSWGEIERWLTANKQNALFPPGATQAQIQEAEKATGATLPEPVREFYSIHDGSNGVWVCAYGYILPLTSVAAQWRSMKELLDNGGFDDGDFVSKPDDNSIRTDWWNVGWIPIVYNECGDYLCFDTVPGAGGQFGQIIRYNHEVGAERTIADGFADWLAELAGEFREGYYGVNAAGDLVLTAWE